MSEKKLESEARLMEEQAMDVSEVREGSENSVGLKDRIDVEATGSLPEQADKTYMLVSNFIDLVGEKGVGAVMAGLGAVLVFLVTLDQTTLNSLAPAESVGGIISGTLLMVIGAGIRMYASKISMVSALETQRLHSEERIVQIKMNAEKEIRIKEAELRSLENMKSIELKKDVELALGHAKERATDKKGAQAAPQEVPVD